MTAIDSNHPRERRMVLDTLKLFAATLIVGEEFERPVLCTRLEAMWTHFAIMRETGWHKIWEKRHGGRNN